MKLLAILTIFLLILPIISAQDDTLPDITPTVNIDKSVNWLMQQTTTNTLEASLIVLAATKSDIINNQDAANKLKALKNQQIQCWPAANCNVKDTAMALFALSRTGYGISASFLSNQEQSNTAGEWLLQIETQAFGSCNIKYEGKTKTIEVDQSRIKSDLCASFQTQFNLNGCLEKDLLKDKKTLDLTIQCGSLGAGKISLVYQVEDKFFLVDDVSNLLTATLKIKNSNFGDYESTLYTSWALKSMNKDVNSLLWLKRFYTPNVISSALMYLITEDEAYINDLLNFQDQTVGNFGSIYETSLATLALRKQGIFTAETDFAKSWLESQMLDSGAWNNDIKDTAIAIYGAFAPLDIDIPIIPSSAPDTPSQGCNNNGECEIIFDENSLNCPNDCYPGDGVCDSTEDEITSPDDCTTTIEEEEEYYYEEEEGLGFFSWLLIIILILAILGGLFYFYYKFYYKTGKQLIKFKKPSFGQPPLLKTQPQKPAMYSRPAYRPVYKPRKTLIEKKLEESLKESKKLLGKK